MRIPISVQILALSLILLALSFWAGLASFRASESVLFEHERLDLRDESSVLVSTLQNHILRAQRDAAALASALQETLNSGSDAAKQSEAQLQEFLKSKWAAQRKVGQPSDGSVVAVELHRLGSPDAPAESQGFEVEGWSHAWPRIVEAERIRQFEGHHQNRSIVPYDPGDLSVGDDVGNETQFAFRSNEDERVPILVVQRVLAGPNGAGSLLRIQVDLREFRKGLTSSPRHVGLLVDASGQLLMGSWAESRLLNWAGKPSFGDKYQDFLIDLATESSLPQHWFAVASFPSDPPDRSQCQRVEQELLAKWAAIDHRSRHYFQTSVSTFTNRRMVISAESRDDAVLAANILEHQGLTIQVRPEKTDRLLCNYFPVALSEREGDYVGLIRAASEQEMRADIRTDLWLRYSRYAVYLVGTAVVLSLIGAWFITTPLRDLIAGVRSVKEGRFVKVKPARFSCESSELGEAYNEMVNAICERNQELEKREARMRSIVDLAAEAIVTIDETGRILSFNHAAQRSFAVPEERARAMTISDFLTWNPPTPEKTPSASGAPSVSARAMSGRSLVASSGSDGLVRNLWGKHANRGWFQAETSISRVASDDANSTYTLIIRDVTERQLLREELERKVERRTRDLQKAKEELEANQRLRELFLHQINHDLRSPLMAIIGYTRQLKRSQLTEAQLQRVNNIDLASNRIQRLVDDLRDYQAIIQGTALPHLRQFDPRELFDQVQKEVVFRATENHVDLTFEAAPDVPLMLSDRDWMLRIVTNLVGNACKFTRNGQVSCRMWREVIEGREQVIIEVSDTGRGLSPEEQTKLFRPYEKIASKEENPDGTGLGLVITRGFCNALNGSVGIVPEKTALGQGATFRVRVPAQMTPSAFVVHEPAGSRAASASDRHLALVIDDDHDICDLLREQLREHDFEVIVAHDGLDGIKQAFEHHPTLITLDAQLPGLDGWRVLRELKETPLTASIPVIMVTVHDNPRKGFALGAADFINKPINWDYFDEVIDRYRSQNNQGTILVVDDDAACRDLVATELRQRHWRVLEAGDGREALARLHETLPDVVLLDLIMPVMDGFEFVNSIRAEPAFCDLPIIVVTGKHLTQEERDRFGGRVQQIFEKQSLAWEELREQISRMLQRVARPVETRSNA